MSRQAATEEKSVYFLNVQPHGTFHALCYISRLNPPDVPLLAIVPFCINAGAPFLIILDLFFFSRVVR